jgi:hypothetical protein
MGRCAMRWFAVRSVHLCKRKRDGTNIFEERVVCFKAKSFDHAFLKAEREADRYAAAAKFKVHGVQMAYEQDSDALIDGYEVWSVMLQSRKSLSAFYAARYAVYDYEPE